MSKGDMKAILKKTKSVIAKDKSQTTFIHCTSGLCVIKRLVPLTLHKPDPPYNFTPSISLKGSRLERGENSGGDKSGLPELWNFWYPKIRAVCSGNMHKIRKSSDQLASACTNLSYKVRY